MLSKLLSAFLLVGASAYTPGLIESEYVIAGYDTVAFWSLQPGDSPVLGSEDYLVEWHPHRGDDGALDGTQYKWLFSSQDNKDRFLADPWAYAPANGGF